jgi:S-formylglutathione hydrolase FrmB
MVGWEEPMPYGELHLFSRALRQTVPFAVVIPDPEFAGPGPYPALLQLHGGNDDYLSWPTKSKIRVHTEGEPLLVVMPNGGTSAWSDWVDPRLPMETFLIEELIPACRRMLPIREGRWAIGGNSIGGYGSLHLGLKHPDVFASVYAHSSVIFGHGSHPFPDHLAAETRAAEDLYLLAERDLSLPGRPVIGLDCGTEDYLLEEGRAFHRRLDAVGYSHAYEETPGGHTWFYWDEHFPAAMRQHLEVLAAG